MNAAGMLHVPDSKFCFPISDNELVIRLRVDKKDSDIKVEIVHGPKYRFFEGIFTKQEMGLAYIDDEFAYFETVLNLEDVRVAYVFEIEEKGKTLYYSEFGLSEEYDYAKSNDSFFQYSYINDIDVHKVVSWADEAVFYQIFIDRFNRGDFTKDDSYIDMKCNEEPTRTSFMGGDIKGITEKLDYLEDLGINAIYLTPLFVSKTNHKYDITDYYAVDKQFGTKDDSYIDMKCNEEPTRTSFMGGDIKGITEKLDYLEDLGINAIYLTPLFVSKTNHKYDITDYYAVDKQFGTKADLKELVEKSHKRGIKVILDAVFNHASNDTKEFLDVVKKGKNSKYFNYFIIHGDKVSVDKPNYEMFSNCVDMPKWNNSNIEVQDFFIDIGLYWIKEFDIDGWRLDVSDEVSHDFWRRFRKAVKKLKKDVIIVGENWHDAHAYLMGDQFDGIMNYAFRRACKQYFAHETINSKTMSERLNNVLTRNTWQVNRMNLNLTDSHDTARFFTECGKNKDAMLAALAVMYMFIGMPCIYYGTELHMEGGEDPGCRKGFDWNEKDWDTEFRNKVKELISLRKIKAVQKGHINITYDKDCFIMERFLDGQHLTIITNKGKNAYDLGKKLDIVSANKVDNDNHKLEPNGYVIFNS